MFALESPEEGFTDDNRKWLKPAKKTKLNLLDSDDDDDDDDVVSITLFML